MEKLYKCIEYGDFNEALEIVQNSRIKDVEETLIKAMFETRSMIPYTIVCHLISHNENASLHHMASVMLSQPLCIIPGSYQCSLFHLKQAMRLDPYNIDLKEYFLFFYGNPDKLITIEEAIDMANFILSVDSNNQTALRFLSEAI
ncbi:hypothetical protein [Priestia filamentosa]|uniref:hypothetical protein n=1 Tax=Priestia filamentosa TaxID=1402861 RepID=UPI003982AF9D